VDANDGVAADVTPWVQDLSAGGAVDETTESELVRINTALLVGGGGSAYTATYGTGGATTLYYLGFGTLTPPPCLGMTLDVQAPSGQYDTTYEVTAFRAGDFSALDDSSCTIDDDSNWDFEDWVTSADPPEDFYKVPATLFTSTQSTATVHDGASACDLTWTTVDNRDFGESWYVPVTVGAVYTFHAWLYDNDPAGRTRPAYQYYDAARATAGGAHYMTTYTTDNPAWVEVAYATVPVPAGSAYLRAFLRMYDVSPPFTTTATLYTDDWAVTSPVTFLPTDGLLDAWTTTAPAAPHRFYDATTPTMDIWAAINDAGTLYVATNEVHAAWSDHLLYVWIGAPHATATVAAPWAKAGTVPAPGAVAGSQLLALAQEESTGFVAVQRWTGSAWADLTAADATFGFDGTTDGTGVVEAAVNLVHLLGLAAANLVPSAVYAAVAPYGTADGGTLDSANQFPHPTAHIDGNVDVDELLLFQRSAVLVGNAM
jgi:hypothetical protein